MKRIDYIFVQGKQAFPDSLKTKIMENYMIVKQTEHYLLFGKRFGN